MRKVLAPIAALLTVLALAGLVACEDEDVGVPCTMTGAIGADGGTSGAAQVNPQAMDCRSRLCLSYGGRALCTKICDDNDECPDETPACKEGFVCVPATETTKLACCKMCVCKKYVVGTDAGVGTSTYCQQHPNNNCPKL